MDRDFKGVWIPAPIWLDNDLSWMEKLFLAEIDSLDNEDGCFASNAYFSEFFKVTKQRCSQIINSLIDKSYVDASYIRKGKEIKKRVLRIFDRGIKNIFYGYQEKFKDNNTINSNTINNNVGNPEKLLDTVEEKNIKYESLAELLYKEHLKHDEKYLHGKDLKATYKRWSNDIRKLIEIDGRSWEEVEAIIKWCQSAGNFWIPNILSGEKLRIKFPTLWVQYKKSSAPKEKKTYEKEYAEKNKELLKGI